MYPLCMEKSSSALESWFLIQFIWKNTDFCTKNWRNFDIYSNSFFTVKYKNIQLPSQPVDRSKRDKKKLLLLLGQQQELTKKEEELKFS